MRLVSQFAIFKSKTGASAREPSQVFVLLETVYQSFDEIAKKRNVFKVSVHTQDCCNVSVRLTLWLPVTGGDSGRLLRCRCRYVTVSLRRLESNNTLNISSHSILMPGIPKPRSDHAVVMVSSARKNSILDGCTGLSNCTCLSLSLPTL